MQADWIVQNVNIATMDPGILAPYCAISDGILACRGDRIVWVGAKNQSPTFDTNNIIDGKNGWLTPGLIDCHTHLVYGGTRAKDFELRLQGKTYAEIARQGGGINCTVTATRAASTDELMASGGARLSQLCREGVTTVEIKSGYGLDLDTELRMLRVARGLSTQLPVTVLTTYLGAHALPPEYQNRADDYIDFVCRTVLPQVAEQQLADAVDVFCENIAFSPAQCKKVFDVAKRLGIAVKGHVEQLSESGGARLVAQFDGLSVDHIEYLRESDISLLEQHSVVAVLLPSAFYFLGETKKPPINAMRNAGLSMAVASDCNPGSSPSASIRLAMNQACILFGLTPEEALTGVTRNAAQALGVHDRKGQLRAEFDADVLLWDIAHPAELSYSINMTYPLRRWIGGRDVQTP